jgi:hypothetical protein
MRRSSYLSRIVRVGSKSGLSLAPVRVLFRPPPPIPDGLRAEASAIFPAEVTPVEPRSGSDPSELTRNVTGQSEHLLPSRNTRTPGAPKLPLAPLRQSVAESSSAVTPGGGMWPSRQVSGPVLVPSSAPSSSAKPDPSAAANIEPRVVSTKQVRRPKVPTRSNTLSAAPVSKRASETSPTVLIPPPPAPREPLAQTAGAEKHAAMSTDADAGVRIGALEVRIMPPPPVTPPAPAAFLEQAGGSGPHVVLSQGFRSFGLTQS